MNLCNLTKDPLFLICDRFLSLLDCQRLANVSRDLRKRLLEYPSLKRIHKWTGSANEMLVATAGLCDDVKIKHINVCV